MRPPRLWRLMWRFMPGCRHLWRVSNWRNGECWVCHDERMDGFR